MLAAGLAFSFLTTTIVGVTPRPVEAALSDDELAAAEGLVLAFGAMAGVDGLDELGDALPFTGILATGASGLAVVDGFTDLAMDVVATIGQPDPTVDDIEDAINGSRNVGGATIAVDVDITGSEITFNELSFTRDDVTVPLGFLSGAPEDPSTFSLAGGDLEIDLALAFDGLTLTNDGSGLGIPTPAQPAQLTVATDLVGPSIDTRLGILDVTAAGTVTADLTFDVDWLDPDSNGSITSFELENSSPLDLLDVSIADGSDVGMNLTLTSTLQGLGGVEGTIVLNHDLSDGALPAPVVDFGPDEELGDFTNMTAGDVLASIVHLATSLRSLQLVTANPQLPLIDQNLGEFADWSDQLSKFFVDLGLSTPANPLDVNIEPEEGTACGNAVDDDGDGYVDEGCPGQPGDLAVRGLTTIEGIVEQLEIGLGVAPGALGLEYVDATRSVVFSIDKDSTFTQEPLSAALNIADELQGAGISSVQLDGDLSVSAAPQYGVNIGVGLDLSDALADPTTTSLTERVFIQPAAGDEPELYFDAPVSANIEGSARIAMLEIELADSNDSGAIPILAKRSTDPSPMISLDIAGIGDDRITLAELFEGMSEVGLKEGTPDNEFTIEVPGAFTATAAANLAVPEFTLGVDGSIGSTPLASAQVTFSWPDVFSDDGPTVTGDPTFNDDFLSFNIDPSDPQALFTAVLTAIDQALALVEDIGGDDLDRELPAIGTSFTDLMGWVDPVQDAVNALAADPAGTLDLLELTIEAAIAQALDGLTPSPDFALPTLPVPTDPIYNPGGEFDLAAYEAAVAAYIDDLEAALGDATSFVTFDYEPGDSPGALLIELDVGVCSVKADHPGCTFEFPITEDFNFDTAAIPDTALSGIAAADGEGTVTLDYGVVASVHLGVELPEIAPAAPGGVVPVVSSPFRVFLADTSGIQADLAGELVNAEFEASVGPFGIQAGETDALPETLITDACNAGNTDDEDEDNFVNDGCPVVTNFEQGADCTNDIDDDEDGVVNDGCPEVDGASESGDQCTNATDDDHDGDPETDDADGAVNDGCPAVEGPSDGEPESDCDNDTDDDGDGEVNDGCEAQGNPLIAKAGAEFSLINEGPTAGTGNDRFYLNDAGTDPSIGQFFSGITPDISPIDGLNCDNGADTFLACAHLPIYGFLGNADDQVFLGNIDFTWADFDATPSLTGADEVLTALQAAGEAFLFDLLAQGIGTLGDAVEQGVSAAAYDVSVPVVGDVLDGGAEVAAKFNTQVVDPIETLVGTLNSANDFGTIRSEIQNFWWQQLNGAGAPDPAPPRLLLDLEDPAQAPTMDDIIVEVLCGDPLEDCETLDGDNNPTYTLVDLREVSFRMAIGQHAAVTAPNFEWGVPGLRLEGDAPLAASVDWRINFGAGVGIDDGFFFLTNTDVNDGNTGDAGNDIEVNAAVDLGPDTKGTDPLDPLSTPALNGDLAFLSAALWNAKDTTPSDDRFDRAHEVSLAVGIDLFGDPTAPVADERIALPQLLQLVNPTKWTVNLDGYVDVNATVATTAALGGGASDAAIPRLLADIHLGWELDTTAGALLDGGFTAEQFMAEFVNVRLDLGSFISDFLGPVLADVQKYTNPLQPIIDTLQAPIPGVSELAELVGADPVTLLDLMEVVSGADLTLIRRLLQVVAFANSLPTNVNLVIPIGEFALDQSALLSTELPATSKDQLVGASTVDPTAQGGGVLSQLGGAGGSNFSEQVALSQGEGGFSFPAFQEPSKLFNLLVGQDVELVEFDAGELKAEVGWSQTFGPIAVGPIPVSVVVSIGAAVEGRFVIGYDTKGIRAMIQNLSDGDDSNNGFFDGLGTLFAGVYISDLADDGSDPPEIRLTLEGSVGAAVDLVVIKAGIEAGLRATLDLNLHDGGFLEPVPPENLDGKLRIDEIITFLSNPICLFDVSGKLEAFIRIFVTLDLFLFSVTYKQTIVNIVLLELENITAELCQPPEPEPASKSGGKLILNVGDRADIRNFDVDNEDEKIVVRQVSPGTTGDVEVSYKGYTELYEDIDLIVGDGDEGDDTFVFEDGDISGTCRADGAVDPPVPGFWSIDPDTGAVIETGQNCLDGGVAEGDTASFLVNFEIALSVCGGPGSDVIGGSDNDDLLVGDGELNGDLLCEDNGPAGGGADDVDTINGGGGDDEIHGNAGPDILEGGSGDDEIFGGAQDDEIIGGIGSDDLYGQDGNDGISGGPEIDPCPDDDHDDCPDGGDAVDYVEGGEGDDSIEGDHGDDDLNGNGGNDTIVGGLGDDTIDGNDGIDNLFGNQGIDTMNGGDGDDDMYGGPGNDIMSGGNHDDDMVGEEGDDQIDGDDGRDVILGDVGGINRDPDPDVNVVSDFTPSAGKLLVELTPSAVPPAGDDDIDGGGDADRIWGQEGDDQIDGDGGPGTDGDDIIRGNEGDDDIRGNAGADEIFGNDGDDVIYGDAAPGDTDPSADGSDNVRGGNGDDVISGNAKGDRLFGDSGADVVYGDATVEEADCADDEDFIAGGAGNDLAFGNADDDDIFGEGGIDRLVGGSDSADVCDGDDAISGGEQGDVIAGDNATIGAGATQNDMLVSLILDGQGAGDHDLDGDNGDDRIFGQVGDDTINGGGGDDYLEGNEGTDTMAGNAGADDLIGGSSAADGVIDDDRVGDGRPDAGDFIDGDDEQGGVDWIAGDNALVSRNVPATGRAPVHLFDVATYDPLVSPPATTFGADEINGGGGFDLIFGQGAGDLVHGDAGDDYIEGNDGDDSIHGDAGADDLVGGGSADDGMIVPGRIGDGLADVGETMISGGDGEDWIAGDNALIDRNLDAAAPSPIRLFDVETVGNEFPMAGGGEVLISGGDGEDWIFGQTGADLIFGDADDDYIEGNNGDDAIHGNAGDDDIVGGGSANDGLIDDDRVGDGLLDVGENVVTGGDGVDWIAGDNALVNRNRPIVGGPGGPQRAPIELFDVQTSGGPSISSAVSGGDLLQGNGGEDRIFGQGNGVQPADQTDPVDGRNNDYNGTTEGDADFDRVLGTAEEDGEHLAGWLGDTIRGGADADEIEGNHGNDLIYGNGDEDDIAGGGSADDGKIWDGMRLLNGANLLDGADIIHGDDGATTDGDHDVIVGDNGWVGRTGATIAGDGPDGLPVSLTERSVTMVETQTDAGTYGDDFVAGNGGHDEIYGQAGDDMLEGEYGSDAIVGDLGTTTTELLGDGDANVLCGEPTFLEPQQPFVGEDICVDGTLFRQVQLYAFDDTAVGAVEGRDVMIGGDGDDWMHGGAGSDLLQGDGDGGVEIVDPDADYTTDVTDPNPASADKDRIFAGDSNGNGTVDPVLGGDGDVSWGGRGDDYTWAGNGDDMIDVRPDGTYPATWAAWAEADVESYHGIDVSYGGWDQDAAQANVAANGPIAGDRMLDWAGVYNISYLCPATYGAYVTVRGQPPQLIQWVIDLAAASGAVDPGTPGSSGYNEVAMVYKPDVKDNTNPIYPGTPGHFTCNP